MRQLFFSGQSFFFFFFFFFPQSQLFSVEGVFLVSKGFRLCFLIMVCTLSVQL